MGSVAPDDKPVKIEDRRRHNFFILDNDLIDAYGPKIGPIGIAVYCCLARHANNGTCRPGQKTIAAEIGASESSVKRSLHQLRELEIITITARKTSRDTADTNVFTLLPIQGVGSDRTQVGSQGTQGWVQTEPTLGSQGPGNNTNMDNTNVNKTKLDPPPTPTRTAPPSTAPIGGGFGIDENRTNLRAAIVREMGHEPLTPDESRAWAKALDNLVAGQITPQQVAKAFKAARDRWSRAENITPPAIVRNLSSLLDNRTGAKRNQDRSQAVKQQKTTPPPVVAESPPTPDEIAAQAAYAARQREQEDENRRRAEQVREQWRQQIAASDRERAIQARESLGIVIKGHVVNCPCLQCQIKRRELQRQAAREWAAHASL